MEWIQSSSYFGLIKKELTGVEGFGFVAQSDRAPVF